MACAWDNCLLAAGAALCGAAHAQTYPAKPVRVIVPFAPGGATDIVTRVVAQKLNEAWGQTVVVDNRAGAGGNIGADIAAKAPPDGYTLLMTSGSIVTANQHIFRKMPFNPEKDLVADHQRRERAADRRRASELSRRRRSRNSSRSPRRSRGTMTFGSAGVGTQTHLAAENFVYTAGIDVVHIPYKGEGPALIDLVGGQIIFVTPNLSAAIGFVQQGKLRALAVTSKAALDAAAGRARRRRDAAGLREPRLVRPDGAGRHAEGGHRQGLPGHREGAAGAGHPQALRAARHGAGRQRARRVRARRYARSRQRWAKVIEASASCRCD